MFKLDQPIPLQLGCVGSRSVIHYGTYCNVSLGDQWKRCYFDVLNVDRYDVIFGVPWLTENGVTLDFAKREIRVAGIPIPTLTVGEEATLVNERKLKH